MKNNIFFLLLSFILIFACSKKPAEPSTQTPSTKTEEPKSTPNPSRGKPPECFRYNAGRDSVYMQISDVYGTMTGMILYKYYQKDKNMGTFQGKMIGDVLLADYTFQSEGQLSVRQVAFKRKGEDFVEGYGDVIEVNGKQVFKNVQQLTYDDKKVLVKVPCKQ